MDSFEAELQKEDLHLARACLLLAKNFRPSVDVEADLARFDPWTGRVRGLTPMRGFPNALRTVLAVEEGFEGETESYYNPENSLLDSVLERRRGLPITLSVVYLEVARRLGEPLVAVGMPGHFLVRYDDMLLDPFHGGRLVTEEECQRMLDAIYHGNLPLREEMLRPTSDREVLARVMANLKAAFARLGRLQEAARVCDRLLQLNPFAFEEHRDRGLLRMRLGDFGGGREDIRRYLQAMPKAPDADRLRALL